METEVESPRGSLLVTGFFAHLPHELPDLAHSGPGRYRIRFHVRDSHDMHAPEEQHRIVSWPVRDQSADRVLKQTDAYGAKIRESAR